MGAMLGRNSGLVVFACWVKARANRASTFPGLPPVRLRLTTVPATSGPRREAVTDAPPVCPSTYVKGHIGILPTCSRKEQERDFANGTGELGKGLIQRPAPSDEISALTTYGLIPASMIGLSPNIGRQLKHALANLSVPLGSGLPHPLADSIHRSCPDSLPLREVGSSLEYGLGMRSGRSSG